MDQLIKSQLLYQLSYRGNNKEKQILTFAPFVNNRESALHSGALRQNFPRVRNLSTARRENI